jgi:hypothetical protein
MSASLSRIGRRWWPFGSSTYSGWTKPSSLRGATTFQARYRASPISRLSGSPSAAGLAGPRNQRDSAARNPACTRRPRPGESLTDINPSPRSAAAASRLSISGSGPSRTSSNIARKAVWIPLRRGLEICAYRFGILHTWLWSLEIYARHARPLIVEALRDTRVVFVMGARQVGKSTLTISIAEHDHRARVLTLDDDGTRAAAQADPIGFVGDGRSRRAGGDR